MRRVPLPASLIIVCLSVHGLSSICQAAVTHNRLASNRLASNRLASNRLASNKLATDQLSADGLTADLSSAGDLLSTADGRDVYAYMISCALPAGVNIVATITGAPDSGPAYPPPYDTTYTCINEQCAFSGGMGLWPKWLDHKLSKKGQRWVSACLFARVNAYDTADAISLRGSNDALAVSDEEIALYTLQEGAFYGQYFTPQDKPIAWFACMGADQAVGDNGGLNVRDCTQPDPMDPTHTLCGFNYTGECADYSPLIPSPYACASFEGFYDRCHDAPGIGKWPKTKKYREVITSYVSQ